MRVIEREERSKVKKILIKCGGSTLDELTDEFFLSLLNLKRNGYGIVIVHGGGPDINKMLKALNIVPEYVNGLRKTNKETLKVVEMVLAGQTNRKLVEKLSKYGLSALGLNGSDSGLLTGDYVDKNRLGYVGSITKVNSKLIETVLESGFIPVITPIASTENGEKLNVNADYAAAAVGNALNAEHCIFVTDVDGIMIDGKVKRTLSLNEIEQFIHKGDIYGGMIPKVQSAISAIEKGIQSVRIVSGKKSFFNKNKWFGTQIIRKEKVFT